MILMPTLISKYFEIKDGNMNGPNSRIVVSTQFQIRWPKHFSALVFLIFTLTSSFAQRNIVAIGDSNGASDIGWVNQLEFLRPEDSIYNYAISGNTIGFDNLGQERLNTLKNIGAYLNDAKARANGTIHDIIVLLGTNDCKKIFSERTHEVSANLKTLVKLIKEEMSEAEFQLYVLSPPPIGPDDILLDKYKGGNGRVRQLLPGFTKVAIDENVVYIDIYNELWPQFDQLHKDGIHLNAKGSKLVAARISQFLDKYSVVAWDDEQDVVWPDAVKVVEIPSSLDDHLQKAYFYPTDQTDAQPLIVSLHTWSGDYTQKDPLMQQVLSNNWNYIHPDFRGANNTPNACGSKYAINDIEDAISFALENANIDMHNIHVIGASGGGYATLYTFMNSKHEIASFSAWVPISDIEAWYFESKGRKNKYADHILSATSSDSNQLNTEEARRRSPLFMDTPVKGRLDSRLNIYAGVHDGYTGSVPITQSLKFYNKVIQDFGAKTDDLIQDDVMLELLTMRSLPTLPGIAIGDRDVVYTKAFKNISITIFEGRHEMLSDVALNLLPIEHEK